MVCCVGENEHRERKQCQIYYTPKAFYFPMHLFKLLQNITSSVRFVFCFGFFFP